MLAEKKKDNQTQIVKEFTCVFAQKMTKAFSRILKLQIRELTLPAESLTGSLLLGDPAFSLCKGCS